MYLSLAAEYSLSNDIMDRPHTLFKNLVRRCGAYSTYFRKSPYFACKFYLCQHYRNAANCFGFRFQVRWSTQFWFRKFPPAWLPAILARARCPLVSYCAKLPLSENPIMFLPLGAARSLIISITSDPTVSYVYCKYCILVVPDAHYSPNFILAVQDGMGAQ
jgi:hypothetical protein